VLSCVNSLHLQLTGRELADTTVEESREPLRQAFLGKDVLLVLDGAFPRKGASELFLLLKIVPIAGTDCWDCDHEAALNFVDDTTRSKVLLSSRVMSVLGSGCDVVEIGRPSTDEAVQMLLCPRRPGAVKRH
jgi:hypothetical protein